MNDFSKQMEMVLYNRPLERAVAGYFAYIEDLIERENVFTMDGSYGKEKDKKVYKPKVTII